MTIPVASVYEPANLMAAYRNARNAIQTFDGIMHPQELIAWDDNLEERLRDVAKRLQEPPAEIPCNLVVIPKADGAVRAYYHIPFEYQVGWAAIVRILGPLLDKRMPNWSFGYRLHRSKVYAPQRDSWLYEDYDAGQSQLYMKFTHAWKPFRRYANRTVGGMLGEEIIDDPVEQAIENIERSVNKGAACPPIPSPSTERGFDMREQPFPYFRDAWRATTHGRLWIAHIDIRKFFPSIRQKHLINRLKRELSGLLDPADLLGWAELITKWLNFTQNATGVHPDILAHLNEETVDKGGLPVGLVGSGLLANVYMLELDRTLDHYMRDQTRHGHVAVMRYVDDQLLIATSREELCRLIAYQYGLLQKNGLRLNEAKLRPQALAELFEDPAHHSDIVSWLEHGGALDEVPKEVKDAKIKDVTSFEERWKTEGSVTRLSKGEFVSTTLQKMSMRAD